MPLFAKIAHHILTTGVESFSQQRQCCHITWDVRFFMVYVSCVLGAWQLNTKPRDKQFLPSCWCVLKLRERPSYPRLLQQMNPGSVILNLRQKVNAWNDAIHHLHGRKNSLSMIVMISLVGLWRIDSCGCDAERGDSELMMPTSGCWQKSVSISDEFGRTRIQQKSCLRMIVQGCTQVWRLRTCHGIWTLYPHPPNCPDLASPDFHLFGALKNALLGTKFETDDYVICAGRN
jgi:hypothetical protein